MSKEDYLVGKILVATPSLKDPRFSRTVICVCSHSKDGAMGLVLNHPIEAPTFEELLTQFNLPREDIQPVDIRSGGPIEIGRGFVLHSPDWASPDTVQLSTDVSLTANIDILKAIAAHNGPEKNVLCLGYAGWTAGQLDDEVYNNAWLITDSNPDLIFDNYYSSKWRRALAGLHVNYRFLAPSPGKA